MHLLFVFLVFLMPLMNAWFIYSEIVAILAGVRLMGGVLNTGKCYCFVTIKVSRSPYFKAKSENTS